MTNVHYLRGQLTMALDCIRRGLDAMENEPDNGGPGHDGPCAAEPSPATAPLKSLPSPYLVGLVNQLTTRLVIVEGAQKATLERMEQLAKILWDIAPDACARHDLFGF